MNEPDKQQEAREIEMEVLETTGDLELLRRRAIEYRRRWHDSLVQLMALGLAAVMRGNKQALRALIAEWRIDAGLYRDSAARLKGEVRAPLMAEVAALIDRHADALEALLSPATESADTP